VLAPAVLAPAVLAPAVLAPAVLAPAVLAAAGAPAASVVPFVGVVTTGVGDLFIFKTTAIHMISATIAAIPNINLRSILFYIIEL
jgi:hypothetical protein